MGDWKPGPWQRGFAFLPIVTIHGEPVWLQVVEYRRLTSWLGRRSIQYRRPPEEREGDNAP